MFQSLAIGHWFSPGSLKPVEILIGLCLFSVVVSGGAVDTVASASNAILVIISLFYLHKWPVLWRALSYNEQLLLGGLALFTLSGLISYYNVGDDYEYIKHMGRYIRFLGIVPVYLLLTNGNMQWFKYLLAGAIFAGPLYLTLALISLSENPELPAKWNHHHITFGDAAMLNVVFLCAVLITWKTRPLIKIIMMLSVVCGLYASILSTARGAWLALPFCGILLLYLIVKSNKVNTKIFIPALLLSILVIAISPAGKVLENRVNQAAQEIELFTSGEKANTSVGGRLAMWDIALDVWQEHPAIGTGPGDFDQEIELRQSQGIYESIDVHASVHNIFLQALATTGLVGFLILCFALVIQPFRLFYQASGKKLTPAKLAGLMVVVAYAVFGLTESWILRAPVVSMYLIYLIALSVTASREDALRPDKASI